MIQTKIASRNYLTKSTVGAAQKYTESRDNNTDAAQIARGNLFSEVNAAILWKRECIEEWPLAEYVVYYGVIILF
ncbi:jg25393 [Pararge aegeria aegeria]|uniref:Jg25393 protein n=1 Tax=Pararge aegeria aegeria TaxID=348720 RepID=A0A8S4S1W0_9NEOP|nr:jg25393 [Pararge aegeria aegeria]